MVARRGFPVGIVILLSLALAPSAPGEVAHPQLLITADQVPQIRQRMAGDREARAYFESIRKRIDGRLDTPVVLPPRGANWYHWYVCPEHGNRLRTGKQIGPYKWEHICPVGGETLPGDPSKPQTDYDGCCLAGIHSSLATEARDAGLLYQITGDARYAARAKTILLAYAGKYEAYPLHNTRGQLNRIGGGRVGCQTLDEAVWLIPVAQAADLIWTALDSNERKTIADHLLLAAARGVILPHRMGIHNIQCWKNSAVGLVGIMLGDEALVHDAIDDPGHGLRAQLEKGVSADGTWYEGAWGYHFYTMNAIYPLALAIQNTRRQVDLSAYHRMQLAPLQLADPRGLLPPFNDSHESSAFAGADLARGTFAWFDDPALLPAAQRANRDGLSRLLCPALPSETTRVPEAHSANFSAAGFAILRKGAGRNATWICLKYGPHGGGHGHPDKLGFQCIARGQDLAIDPGITSYGSKLHGGWYRTTIAHNTLTIDERNQSPATGKCLGFGSSGGVDYAILDAGPIAPGVTFRRTTALMDENLLVLIDQVSSDTPHTFDLAFHLRGQFGQRPAGDAWTPPEKPGYSYLADGRIATASTGSVTVNGRDGQPARIAFVAGGAGQLITATGVGGSTKDRVPAILYRERGQAVTLVTCISLDGAAAVPTLEKPEGASLTFSVVHNNRRYRGTLDAQAGSLAITTH